MTETNLLAAALAESHPAEAAAMLENFGAAQSAEFLAELSPEIAGGVLHEMSGAHAAASVGELAGDTAASCLNALPSAVAARLLRILPADRRDNILGHMNRARQVQIGLILRQPRMSVGAWMESTIKPVRAATLIGDAKRQLQEFPTPYANVYVIDDGHNYVGSVAAAGILAGADDVPIERIYQKGGATLRAGSEIDVAMSDPSWKDNDEMPVVDRFGKLVGVIRYAELRSAVTKLDDRTIDSARAPGTSFMDFADLWYVGLARILDTSLSRRQFPGDKNGTHRDGGSA